MSPQHQFSRKNVPSIFSSILPYFAFIPLSFAIGSIGLAQEDIRRFANSDWTTVYDAPSGQISATVHLRGESGFYVLKSGAKGILSNVRYFDSFEHEQVLDIRLPSAPTPAIVGVFNLYGATGFFVFRAPDANGEMDGYSGSWVNVNSQTLLCFGGSWDGTLVNMNAEPKLELEKPKVQVPQDEVKGIAPTQPDRDEDLRRELADLQQKVKSQALQTAALLGAFEEFGDGRTAQEPPPIPNGYEAIPPQQVAARPKPIDNNFNARLEIFNGFVCRFVAKKDFVHPISGNHSANSGFGTGFLVGPSLVLTCNHVVPDEHVANAAKIQFGDSRRRVIFSLADPAMILSSSHDELDYSLLRVQSVAGEPPAAMFNHYYLSTSVAHRGSLLFGDLKVNLIHYPLGKEDPEFALREVTLRFRSNAFVAYDAHTEKGSSGSPVFNDLWWLIAMHSGKTTDKSYGKGIAITNIIDDLKMRADKELLAELQLDQ